MTDVRAEDLDEGDRLPWLEAVDEDDGHDGPSALKLIVAVLIGLAAIGGIVGGLFWLGNRHAPGASPTAEVETIKAPEGAYKVKPDHPGGMNVQGQGDTSFAASAGAEPKGRIDTNAVPETPVSRTGGAAPAAPPQAAHAAAAKPPAQASKPAAPAKPAPAPAKPAPAATDQGGGSIQLGAFSSQAGAEKAWKALSGRFSYVAPLGHNVVPVSSGGRTLYRLRAGGAGAADVCGRLRVAGESCVTLD
jgi:cell division septation protein DedD